jgi:hypothetical protein
MITFNDRHIQFVSITGSQYTKLLENEMVIEHDSLSKSSVNGVSIHGVVDNDWFEFASINIVV